MISIKQLLDNPPQRIGGFNKNVFKTKKNWPLTTAYGELWYQQVVLKDETDEILANFCLGTKRILLQRTQDVRIVVAETKDTDDGRVLEVEEYTLDSVTEPPFVPNFTGAINEVEGKTRCRLVCADKIAGKVPDKDDIRMWTKFIIDGR